MAAPGDIYSEQAYALGKMLDHSAWQMGDRRLPRGITGSDVDGLGNRFGGVSDGIPATFDNSGRTILVELSSHLDRWRHVPSGQRWVYEALIAHAPHCAVLCRHNVTLKMGRKICTRYDVVSFQPMFYDHGVVIGDVFQSNDLWQKFVFEWFEDPIRARRRFIGLSAGMVAPPQKPAVALAPPRAVPRAISDDDPRWMER